MGPAALAGVFLATYLLVTLRCLGSLVVVHRMLAWVPFVSFGLAAAEVTVVAAQAHNGFGPIVLPIGLGGTLGTYTALYIHKRFHKK